jgi:hypothetical protein
MNAKSGEAAQAAGASAGARQRNPAVSKIVEKALAELAGWEEEKPRKERDEKLFYCPMCSYTLAMTYYRLKKYGKPKCPTCGVEMIDFDESKFRELRRRLAEEARKILPDATKALLDVAAIHGSIRGSGGEPEVVVEGAMVIVRPDHTPNEFRYNASKRRLEAFYYYYDTERHEKSLKELATAAWRLGLGIHVTICPDHAKMPIPFPHHRDAISGITIDLNRDELWGYMTAMSRL